MAERTNMIAQHSEEFIITEPLDLPPGVAVPPGTRIVQEFDFGQKLGGLFNGLFRFELVGDGWYRIVSAFSGMVFDVAGGSKASGAPIILWPWHWWAKPTFPNQESTAAEQSIVGVLFRGTALGQGACRGRRG
jgi:hypothetical protein